MPKEFDRPSTPPAVTQPLLSQVGDKRRFIAGSTLLSPSSLPLQRVAQPWPADCERLIQASGSRTPPLQRQGTRDEHDQSVLGLLLYAISSCFLATTLVFTKKLGQTLALPPCQSQLPAECQSAESAAPLQLFGICQCSRFL